MHRRMRGSCARFVPLPGGLLASPGVALAIALGAAAGTAGALTPPLPAFGQPVPIAEANDQRRPAGRMIDGVLRIDLEAVEAEWLPRGPEGPRVRTTAFREVGRAPQVPGPLIRVAAGTLVRVGVRNTLDRPIAVWGFVDRLPEPSPAPGAVAYAGAPGALPAFVLARPLVVAPGERGEAAFTPTRAVSSFYFARTVRPEGGEAAIAAPAAPGLAEGVFMGALIVDPPDIAADSGERVLMITRWNPARGARGDWKMTVNGLAWPYSERLEYTMGDAVRWRVINASSQDHPMHLHGFYFRVDAQGDTQSDTVYEAGSRPLVVTRLMEEFSTLRLTWIPERPGNWLFHCHLVRHMGEEQHASFWPTSADDEPEQLATGGVRGMAGLITGITIRPREGAPNPTPPVERRIDLWTGTRPDMYDGAPELGFVVQEGPAAPPPDSTRVPGSPLILYRGEPVEIIVHNRLDFPLSVHWHGLEIQSLYDGVGGWSGRPGNTRPPIAPGDSVGVVITPPRAGSFMYHTHGEPGLELSQGLYGPLLVLEPGEARDPDADRVFVLAARGASFHAAPVINGETRPPPERFVPGRTYRLRLLQISSDEHKRIRLLKDGVEVQWRPLAKDGADLNGEQALVPAVVGLGVGETYDVVWSPEEPGAYVLEVTTEFFPDGTGGHARQAVAFGVGDVEDAALHEAARAAMTLPEPSSAERARFAGTYVGSSPLAPGLELRLRIWEEAEVLYSEGPFAAAAPDRLYATAEGELAAGRALEGLVRTLRFRFRFEEGSAGPDGIDRIIVTDEVGHTVAGLKRLEGDDGRGTPP